MKRIASNRRGIALAVAILAIVVIGALVAGAFFASTQEYRIGRNTGVQENAFNVAEQGLGQTIANWDKALNIAMQPGDTVSYRYVLSATDTARVMVTRTSNTSFWLVSEGSSGRTAATQARRRVNSILTLAMPTVKVGGAIMSNGNIDIKGSATVSGTDQRPAFWDLDTLKNGSLAPKCTGYALANKPAVNVGVGDTVTIQKASAVTSGVATGSTATLKDTIAGNDANYSQFGDISLADLIARADIILPSGGGSNPSPVGTDTTCTKVNSVTGLPITTNWGEPSRGQGRNGCKDFFPIIYAPGDVSYNGGRGQGVLIVNGNLDMNGGFEFYGLIIVKDDIAKANGTAKVYGSVFARNSNIIDGNSLLGNVDFQYSNCAVQTAIKASSNVTAAHRRGWAEMF